MANGKAPKGYKRNPSCVPRESPKTAAKPKPAPKPAKAKKPGAMERLGDKLLPGFAKVKKALK